MNWWRLFHRLLLHIERRSAARRASFGATKLPVFTDQAADTLLSAMSTLASRRFFRTSSPVQYTRSTATAGTLPRMSNEKSYLQEGSTAKPWTSSAAPMTTLAECTTLPLFCASGTLRDTVHLPHLFQVSGSVKSESEHP